MDDSKKYINLDENSSIPKKSTIFYNNLNSNNDENIVNNLNLVPSILDDQFGKLKNRNHYLKNTFVLIDSKNRDSIDRIISQYINFEKIAILFNVNYPGILFFTLFNSTLKDEDMIIFEKINIMNNSVDTLNGVNINIIEYDKVSNTPIFTLTSYTNKQMISIFEWNALYPVVKDIFSDTKQFTSGTDVIFYSFRFGSDNYKVDDYLFIDSNKSFTIKKVNNIITGYNTSTYYKIPLSYKLYNIYKIKLVDIKLPKIIFNINNTILDSGKYSYGVNAYFKMILKSNIFNVSNIDYVCQSINYNYFNRESLYDNLNTYYRQYLAGRNADIPKYTGSSIITVIDDLIKNCSQISLKSLIDKYGFQVAYYFLYKYTNYSNTYNNLAYAYYIITLDFFKNLDDKLIKRENVLNNKMPLIYYDNTIIYVNNDTYQIGLYNVNYHDLINMNKKLKIYSKIELKLQNLAPNPVIGNVCSISSNNINTTYSWSYYIDVKPTNADSFNPKDMLTQVISSSNDDTGTINTIYEYVDYQINTQCYRYKVYFLDNYDNGSWMLGDTLYLPNKTLIAEIENIIYEILIDTTGVENKNYSNDSILYICNIEEPDSKINYRIVQDKIRYDTHLSHIGILLVSVSKTDNPKIDSGDGGNDYPPLTQLSISELANQMRTNVIFDSDDKSVGKLYYIGYYPISYSIVFEKSNHFENMNYLQRRDIIIQIQYDGFETYSYVNSSPLKTSKHNLETYNVYPVYDIKLPNGYYNESELSKQIETELNNTDIKIFDYQKKDFINPDKNKNSLNINDFTHPIFKNTYNAANREFSISAYQKNNRTKYNAFFNSINPYLFLQFSNCIVQNNERLYFEVGDIYDSKLSGFASKYFNKEITTRILPTYKYALRLISPIPDNYIEKDVKSKQIYETLDKLLEQIKINPYEINTSFPNLNTKLKNIGTALINKYNNNFTLNQDGTINENKGVPCLLNRFELCICITNIHYSMESYKLGRVCKIDDNTSNKQGNFNVRFQMSGDNSHSFPFYIGDIIYSLDTKQFFCIVPNEWGMFMEYPQIAKIHNTLPSNDIIRSGYINYLSILYKYTQKIYLFQLINDYNLHKFNQFRKYEVGHPWKIWFIQEEFNANYGFEIYFDYDKDITFNDKLLQLSFLKCEDFSMFFEDNKSPKDIMGIDIKKINKIQDFQDNSKNIPFYHTLSNLTEINMRNIKEFYFTYGSDSILRNKIYLSLDNVNGFTKGDTVFFKNLVVEPIFRRNLFSIRETVNHSINKYVNFEMYLNIVIYRLVFIKLGIPIPNAANDISAVICDYIEKTLNAVDNIANEINILSGDTSYENYISINNIDDLKDTISNNGKLVNNLNITSSEIISAAVKDIRDELLYKKILPWFLVNDNLLHFTRGSQSAYFEVLNKYVNIENNIYRLELKIEDDLFIFVENLHIYDEQNVKIGIILDTSLYNDYIPESGLIYHIYIKLDTDYNNELFINCNNTLKSKTNPDDILNTVVKIYTELYNSEKTLSHYNCLNVKPTIIDTTNNWIYFYDTYLRFKVIITANPNQNINENNTLNFNIPSSITSTYNNLFNTDNMDIDIFKNGYYVYIGSNENFEDAPLFNETYRTCISMLDNKNIIASCEYLGILPDIIEIQVLNSYITEKKKKNESNTDEYKLKVSNFTSLMKKYVDIIQILVDFPAQHTFMINLDWTNQLEAGSLDAFKYNIRRMNSIFQVLGNQNFILDNFTYVQDLVYGNPTKNKDNDLSNINLYFYNLFKNLVSNESVKEAYDNNTINELCNWKELYSNGFKKLANDTEVNFDNQIDLFQTINILHGYVVYGTNIDSKTGLNTKTVWILFSNYVFVNNLIANNSNLNNFIITFNFIFIDQNKQYNVDSIEYNQYVDNNIIISAVPEKLSKGDDDYYRIFKIDLKFTPKYPIRRGTPICIKDYYTQVYKNAEVNINMKGTNILYIHKNWTNQISIKKDIVIHINMGSNNLLYKKYISKQVDFSNTLNSYQIDNYTNEEINVIMDTEEIKLSNGKMVIKCTMQNPIRFEFAHDIPIIIRYAPIYNNTSVNCQNSINISLLSTVPILINNEWYTRIYYGSSSNMNIFDVSKNGLSAFQNNSNRAINISGMKGYIQPNIGFQKEERTYIFNSSTKEEELNNKYIKPVPNGIYNIEYFQKEDGLDFMEDGFNNFTIPGYYKPVYNMNSPEQDDEWIDNYINIITVTMQCTVDISAVDFSNGINLYDDSNMILLCQVIGATKISNIIYNLVSNTETNLLPENRLSNGVIIWNNPTQSLSDKLFISLVDINGNKLYLNELINSYLQLKAGEITQTYIITSAIADQNCWTLIIDNKTNNNLSSKTDTNLLPNTHLCDGEIIWNNPTQSLSDKLFISLIDKKGNKLYFNELINSNLQLKAGEITQTYIITSAIADQNCWTLIIKDGIGDNIKNHASIEIVTIINNKNYTNISNHASIEMVTIANKVYQYKMDFELKINTNYNNYKFGFNLPAIIFTDLSHTFYAKEYKPNSFPLLRKITSKYIDYNKVSNLPKYRSNYITIKGKYLGYGGYISLLNKNDIFNQIPYKISDVNSSTNNIELDLEFSSDIYTFYYRNNNFMNSENFTNDFLNTINYNHKSISSDQINPLFSNFQEVSGLAIRDQTNSGFMNNDFTNIVTSNYCIYPIKYGLLSNNATIFKKTIYKPFSVDVLDYIFMCINNIDSNFIVEQQNTINNKIILAKIYIDKPLNNIDLQVRHYDLVFDVKLIPSIEELEIIYIDKNGNLVNFNNVDNNFTLEVSQYLERVQNINTKNGMVF
jgi:hypothetical protein